MRAPTSPEAVPAIEPMTETIPTGGGRVRAALTGAPGAFAALATTVLAFTGGWARGELVIDGPGIAVYVRLALRYLTTDGRVPYWLPDMWAGTPVWAIGPSFPAFVLLPFAAVMGPSGAVKAGILGLQIAGACGAFVLTRSLWKSTPAALLSGVVYGVGPLVVSHAALSGSESTMGVIAAAPWLTWALRHGLRGHGTRYLVFAGLVAAFAVLHQAEYAYGLALLGFFQVLAEILRIRSGAAEEQETGVTVGRILARTGLPVVICLGLIAHWLLPFLAMSEAFILSPPELVQGELLRGVGHAVGNELGYFLRRSGELRGVVSVFRENLLGYALYLGVVPVAVTCLTAVIVARRNGDRTFSGILVASVGAMWLSTGSVALAASAPATRGQVVPMAVLGALAGVIGASYVRRLQLGRAGLPVLGALLAFLVLVPYQTPFLTLQRSVPLLDSIRFSRFYVVAILALALGTAWPVAHVGQWLPEARVALRRLAPPVLAVVLAGAVIADAWPYRSFYSVRQPDAAAAYNEIRPQLAAMAPGTRVATPSQDGRTIDTLLRQHKELSLGWPHPVAYGQVWRITIGAAVAPPGFGKHAFGLSSTAYTLIEQTTDRSTSREAVSKVDLRPVEALPRVRAYERTVVIGDGTVSPELATGLARRNVGVVMAQAVPSTISETVLAVIPPGRSCLPEAVAGLDAGIAGEVGIACGMNTFLPRMAAGNIYLGPDATPGASFTAMADGLRGVSIWFEGIVGNGELVLREVGPDGRTGAEVARGRIDAVDEYEMAVFGFKPIADSAGKRYTFAVECPGCYSEIEPQALAALNVLGTGNLLVNGRLDTGHTLNFTPVYERMETQPPSTTQVNVVDAGPGHWKIRSSGTRATLVVVADANFPGWRARVDGRRVPVLEADGAFISVAVGAGEHEISFDYGPGPAAIAGRLITLGTLLALAGGLVSSRRRLRDALEVRTPPLEAPGEQALGPGERHPRPTVAGGQRPRREGDQAVLAAGDDREPGVVQHEE